MSQQPQEHARDSAAPAGPGSAAQYPQNEQDSHRQHRQQQQQQARWNQSQQRSHSSAHLSSILISPTSPPLQQQQQQQDRRHPIQNILNPEHPRPFHQSTSSVQGYDRGAQAGNLRQDVHSQQQQQQQRHQPERVGTGGFATTTHHSLQNILPSYATFANTAQQQASSPQSNSQHSHTPQASAAYPAPTIGQQQQQRDWPPVASDPAPAAAFSHIPIITSQGGDFMTLNTGGGPIRVPVNISSASKAANEKRKRNAGASARFRQRRKEREEVSSRMIDELQHQIRDLEEDVQFYRGERDYFAGIVGGQQSQQLPSRPPSPRRHRPSRPSISRMESSSSVGDTQTQADLDMSEPSTRRGLTDEMDSPGSPAMQATHSGQISMGTTTEQYGGFGVEGGYFRRTDEREMQARSPIEQKTFQVRNAPAPQRNPQPHSPQQQQQQQQQQQPPPQLQRYDYIQYPSAYRLPPPAQPQESSPNPANSAQGTTRQHRGPAPEDTRPPPPQR